MIQEMVSVCVNSSISKQSLDSQGSGITSSNVWKLEHKMHAANN